MKKLIPFYLLLFCCQATYAQYGFAEAVLVTKDNDTLTCEVLREITYDKEVTYRMGPSDPKRSIPAKDVKWIKTQTTYLENIQFGKKERIMNLVSDGNIRLFNHVTINKGQSVSGGGGTYTLYTEPTVLYAWQKDGLFYEITKKNLLEMAQKLMSDCQDILEKVKNKEYKFNDMGRLVTEYNSFEQ